MSQTALPPSVQRQLDEAAALEAQLYGPAPTPEVVNTDAAVLGRLDYFADLPAGAVMVVKGEREHWVPAAPKHLLKVDLAAKRLTVDWPAELE